METIEEFILNIVRETNKSLKAEERFVFIEFGCCDGYHTELFSKLFKKEGVPYLYLAFEANPELYAYAKQRCKQTDVLFFNEAISKYTGKTKFYLSSNKNPSGERYYGSSSTHLPTGVLNAWPDIVFKDTIEVSAITLDEIFRQNNLTRINFIWADIQGAENDMILGGKEALKKNRLFIYRVFLRRLI